MPGAPPGRCVRRSTRALSSEPVGALTPSAPARRTSAGRPARSSRLGGADRSRRRQNPCSSMVVPPRRPDHRAVGVAGPVGHECIFGHEAAPALRRRCPGLRAPPGGGSPEGRSGAVRASPPGWRSPGGRPGASARRRGPCGARRAPWPRRPGPGRRPRATSGSSDPWTIRSGLPLRRAASSAGCRTESSLAQASTEAGKPGVVIRPVWRQR